MKALRKNIAYKYQSLKQKLFHSNKLNGISVIVVIYDMPRQAENTIYSLSKEHQKNISFPYEVVIVENKSKNPLSKAFISSLPAYYRYEQLDNDTRSPCHALNFGAKLAKNSHIMLMIDGARLLTPGVINKAHKVFQEDPSAHVETMSWHIGPTVHQNAKEFGYNEKYEKELLSMIRWKESPYKLLSVSTLSKSSAKGKEKPISESNCFGIAKKDFLNLGGYNENFVSIGGGLANLDIHKKIVSDINRRTHRLSNEGGFHQIHGGASTSGDFDKDNANQEYTRIIGEPYSPPDYVFCLH